MSFIFLEHTADVLFEAENENFEKALEDAAAALSKTISDKVEKIEEFEFEENAENLEELVVFVLSRLLAESQILGLLPGGMRIKELKKEEGKFKLMAKGWAGKGESKTDVKAVTYHLLKVEESEGKCKIRVLLDV